jgi:sialic acid synthase SpsE/sugar phosphate isomerase/epimerase
VIIENKIEPFVIHSEETVGAALKKIDGNNEGFVFCIDEAGVLEGVLTDGDFRRWFLNRTAADVNSQVAEAMNKAYISAALSEKTERISALFSEKIKFIPLLDERKRLMGLARRRQMIEGIRIGPAMITEESRTFIIAEVGINHNGSVDKARKLIEASKAAGVDCVKFQMRNLDALYRNNSMANQSCEDLSAQYTWNLVSKYELPVSDMIELFDYSQELGLIPLCTPWEQESLKVLEEYGMSAYKVASADLTNHPFLVDLAKTYKPLVISTGMSLEEEIEEAVGLLKEHGTSYCLLHCNSTYPVPFKDINLNYLGRLQKIGECLVGYSGHERGIAVSLAAVTKGAKIIEKHITLDRAMEGSDHKVSLLPEELKTLVRCIREVEEAVGSGHKRVMSQGEVMNRANLAKSLVINQDLHAGEVIQEYMIDIKSPGRGLQPHRKKVLVGRVAVRDFMQGDFFYPADLEDLQVTARSYHFSRPWGVTVRWHDFKTLLAKSNPDFLEFHLSFKDMDEEYLKYFEKTFDLDLKVHSPDTFEGDHLLDLANSNRAHRERSVWELQRVINLTRSLKPYFLRAKRPQIIASLGGFRVDRFLSTTEIADQYGILGESLSQLDTEGVELIGQTLPPFPWYFGGQLYLNLFVHPEDTAAFCKQHRLRLCFDVCHSKLACNYFKYSFKEFIDQIGPYIGHLHIADAAGVDAEGLQIDEGDIDFPALVDQLWQLCPQASFIPEIWQGHKNEGEGFWTALERLERYEL